LQMYDVASTGKEPGIARSARRGDVSSSSLAWPAALNTLAFTVNRSGTSASLADVADEVLLRSATLENVVPELSKDQDDSYREQQNNRAALLKLESDQWKVSCTAPQAQTSTETSTDEDDVRAAPSAFISAVSLLTCRGVFLALHW